MEIREQILYRLSWCGALTKLLLKGSCSTYHTSRGFSCMANTLPHWIPHWVSGMILLASAGSGACARDEAHQWTRSTEFEEMAFTETIDSKIRIHVNAPRDEKGNA